MSEPEQSVIEMLTAMLTVMSDMPPDADADAIDVTADLRAAIRAPTGGRTPEYCERALFYLATLFLDLAHEVQEAGLDLNLPDFLQRQALELSAHETGPGDQPRQNRP